MSAGKTLGKFFGGLALLALGIMLVMMNTTARFNWYTLGVGGMRLSSGLLMIPFIISIVLLIALKNKWIGGIIFWITVGVMLIALILSIEFVFKSTSMFNMVLMFIPIPIGLGLILNAMTSNRGNTNKGE